MPSLGDTLEAIGALPDDEIDLADAALQLARRDAPSADWQATAAHLSVIAADAAALSRTREFSLSGRAGALAELLVGGYGYRGDTETYDDLANANLIRVVERRRGLPVALGILWLHAAQAAGWTAAGINLANHFMVGLLSSGPGTAVLPVDVFAGVAADTALDEVDRVPFASPRETLLRLQNNILIRRLAAGDEPAALACLEDMLRIAPRARRLRAQCDALRRKLGLPEDE